MTGVENYHVAFGTLREAAGLLRASRWVVDVSLVSPVGLAEPLARWLDHQADLLPTAVGGVDNADIVHALAVARVILGSVDS